MKDRKNILYISYNGLLEPIVPSQVIPYLESLSGKGFDFTLLTYEKKADLKKHGKESLNKIKEDLCSRGIKWHYLRYHKHPRLLSTVFDLLFGAVKSYRIIKDSRIGIVHLRGVTPGFIALLIAKLADIKILFDMRGLLAEEYVGGKIWKEGSVTYRLVKKLENNLLKRSDAIVVLTNKHMELNKEIEYLKNSNKPMEVIPCCVDMGRFSPDRDGAIITRKKLGLDGRFVLLYPGKIGTFYLVDEMMEFFKHVKKEIPQGAFLIITRDEHKKAFDIANRHGLDANDIKVISAEFNEMPGYLNVADFGIFFLNPYKKLGSSPIKMGEFLSCGIPVVTNSGIGDTDFIVNTDRVGIIVERLESRDYSDAAEKLKSLYGEGEVLRKRCRDTAKKYLSLEDGVNKYGLIYRRLQA